MSYKEISKDIKENDLKLVYLLHGEEQYLIDSALEQIHEKYVNPDYEDFNYIVIDADIESTNSFFNALETLPFFEERKIIIVKNTPYFKAQGSPLTDNETDRLISYLEGPYVSNCILFVTEAKLDKRKKITKTIQKNGSVIEMKKLDNKDLERWITKKLKLSGKDILSTELRYLITTLGYLEKHSEKKLYDIDNDIKKLIAMSGEKIRIERADIDLAIEKPVENNIFLLVDATADKDGLKAFSVLHKLLLSGEAEIKILFMITRHFKILNRVKVMLEMGYTTMAIAPEISLPQFIAKNYVKQASKFSLSRIRYILKTCTEYDRRIKTGKMTADIAIEVLMTEISSTI